ncbi:MAG: AAA family ATPase [Spirochaetes bacterium]|nr:AAA family ATPase [Spirochaetota bacterium]
MIRLPEYTVTEKVYESQHSVVYRGLRDRDRHPAVLKMLKASYPSQEEVARLNHEFHIISSLNVDGVIQVLELRHVRNTLFMAMEDIGGESLRRQIHLISHRIDIFLDLAIRITKILSGIHKNGVIYKDMKPANLIWNRSDDRLRLIDFSISSRLTKENPSMLNPGRFEGTLAYMSPEQTGRMNRTVDYRSDFYSLGITFYQILMGFLPFQGSDTMEMVHSHIARMPMPPHELASNIPKALSDIIMKLMAKNQEDRYQSTAGILSDLERCRDLLRDGGIEYFAPGEQDVPDTFRLPQRLYGRDGEVGEILNCFHRTIAGPARLLAISGYAGVGKSALVGEIHRPVTEKKGYFIAGKFDQYHRNDPYSALAQAFRDLTRQLLSESESRLAVWRDLLVEALGPNGSIMTDMVPELVSIIGPQPKLPQVNPAESENRFIITLRNFISIFAREDHPLVIFLDDLQWSDPPSLNLIQRLLLTRGLRSMLIIGAYRDNEVREGHPLLLLLTETGKAGILDTLSLNPLDRGTVNRYIADAITCDTHHSLPLTEMVYRKTEGNPFFTVEFLKRLYREGWLSFSYDDRRWQWNPERIGSQEISDNVIEFMIDKLKCLPDRTLKMLQLASCMGNFFDLKTLSVISETTPAAAAEALWEAARQEVIYPLDDRYRLMLSASPWMEGQTADFDVTFRFQHDRVQQAAYSMVGEEDRPRLHLTIGRLMLRFAETEERDDLTIRIAHHLNEASELITGEQEREAAARLNLAAAIRARLSTAYQPALQYVMKGIGFLKDNPWEEQYDLTFELHSELSQAAYLCGEFRRAEEIISLLMERSRTVYERARILRMQAVQYTVRGKLDEAINAGIRGLALLGIRVKKRPSKLAILREILQAKRNMRGRDIADIVKAPLLTDPEKKLSMRILMELGPPAYLSGNPNLMVVTNMKQVNISLCHGNSPESAYAYTTYGAILAGYFGRLRDSYEFGKTGVMLNEQFNDLEIRCRILFNYSVFIHGWNEHWKTMPAYLHYAVDAGLQSGDLTYTSLACYCIPQWDPQIDLAEAVRLSSHYLGIIESANYQDVRDRAMIFLRLWQTLQGATPDTRSLDGDGFDEESCLARMKDAGYNTGVAGFHLAKLQLSILFERYAEAPRHVREIDRIRWAIVGTPSSAEFCIHSFLASSLNHDNLSPAARLSARARMRREYRMMRAWTDNCRENFLHHRYLMEAETLRISGRIRETIECYDRSIDAAIESGFSRYAALANELAARFLIRLGSGRSASSYLEEAAYLYDKWGAKAKAAHLRKRYGEILGRIGLHNPSSQDPSSTDGTSRRLDLDAVVKLSQAVSREMVLENLLRIIIRIAVENAGARRGILCIYSEGRPLIVAESVATSQEPTPTLYTEAHADREGSFRITVGPPSDRMDMPESVVNYVRRTGESVILDNASASGMFMEDPRIVKDASKSILCLSINDRGGISGFLYLENNLAAGIFTPERLEFLSIMMSQCAISINNALFLEREKKNAILKSEIEMAKTIQEALLPRVLPLIDDIAIAYRYKPMSIVGGDYVNIVHGTESGMLGLFISDVSGHGIPAAMTSSTLSTTLDFLWDEHLRDPALMIAKIQSALRGKLGGNFITACICAIDLRRGTLTTASAGHPPCIVINRSGDTRFIRAPGRMIYDYFEPGSTNVTARLERGDRILMYTDGIIDTINPEGRMLGLDTDWFFSWIRGISERSPDPDAMCDNLLRELAVYTGNESQEDDVTMLVLDYFG